MRNDLCEILVIVDRSGSMGTCRKRAEAGLNEFLADQARQPGEAKLTLVQFDTEYEVVHSGLLLTSPPPGYTLTPRGMTALLDAIGKGITTLGERLANTPEENRPGCVVVCILTDGEENASREYTLDKIRAMIKTQQDVYSWRFTFLGSDPSTFAQACSLGISRDATMQFSSKHYEQTCCALSDAVSGVRGACASGAGAGSPGINYSETDRSLAMGDTPQGGTP